MEPFRYQLTFDSSFIPAGADAAENAIRRVGDEASRATRTAVSNDSAIQRVMTDNAAKARVSTFAYYDLDAAIRKTNHSNNEFGNGNNKVTKSTRDGARSLLLFSQGFEDAQYGIRGVLNNIPGLVMALGGTAGLAGAISIAAVAGSVLFEWLGRTEQKASDTEEKLKKLGEQAEQIKSDKIALMTQGLWDAWDAADAVRQNYEETKKASDSYSTAALSNAEKLRQAEMLVAEVLGIQVDKMRELQLQAERAAQKRQLEAQQAIKNQNDAIQAALDDVEIARQKLETARQDQAINAADLKQEKEKLAILEKQHQTLQQQAKERVGWAEALAMGGAIPGVTKTQTAVDAEKQMNTPGYTSNLESVRARVKALEDAVGGADAAINRSVVRMENQFKSTEKSATDKIAAAQIQIQTLQETLNADTSLADAKLVNDKAKAMAESLKETMTQITARTADQQEAKAFIEQASADGKFTADELVGLARNLMTLTGGLQTGLSTSNQNVAQLINQMRVYQSDQAVLDREIKALKANYKSVTR